ncbi:MAG TPA: peptidylprolyl isomerase [Propionibacteriaceae bacterium]|nr:peptidylprolyl isomerase [Propionibacteriaceae bacterium]
MITPYAAGAVRGGSGVDNFTVAGLSLPGSAVALWHSTTVDQLPASVSRAGGDRAPCAGSPKGRARRAFAPMIIGFALLISGCGQIPSPTPVPEAPATSLTPSPVPSASGIAGEPGDVCEYSTSGDAARPVKPPPTTGVSTSGTISYLLAMTNGEVTITLDRTKAPCTVNSFVSLADQGYFDNTRCHRLADSGIFVLQCGDPTGTGNGGPGYEFANETDGTESYTEGVVAMANGGPGTNGSQFFLVWADSTSLDETPNFTIFGEMNKASRDVVASMAGEGQDGSNADGTGRPNNPCEITTVTRA